MINFELSIRNPLKQTLDWKTHTYYCNKMIAPHKSFEIQCSAFSATTDLFKFHLDLSWFGAAHAGPKIEISIWRFLFAMNVYDHRHWNFETNTWYTLEETAKENAEWAEYDD
jgi:hypothetical protein